MKNRRYFFLIIAAFVGCAGYSQKATDVVKIEFTSLTRGFNKQVVITSDSLSVVTSVGRGGEKNQKKKLTVKEWEKLMESLQGVSMTEIPELKSPTEKRAFDGARHSTISIVTKKQETISHSFDDETPHQKLQKLMNAIIKLEKSIE